MERMPATDENIIPLIPFLWPKKPGICPGLERKLRTTIIMNAISRGMAIWSIMFSLILSAATTRADETEKRIA
jgi:hypothetical protein